MKTRFPLYAVARGKVPGIYTEWSQVQQQIAGYAGAYQKGFKSITLAEEFLEQERSSRLHVGAGKVEATKRKRPAEEVGAREAVKEARRDNGWTCVYTDGAARKNGKTGAKAGFGIFYATDDPRNVSEPLSTPPHTNQRAELAAILHLLRTFPRHEGLVIATDSMYAINCLTSWHQMWARKNWTQSQGNSVKNQDLIEAALALLSDGRKVRFEHVRGHCGDPGNTAADALAVAGALRA